VEFINRYFDEVRDIAARIDRQAVERLVELLVDVRQKGGRLFILGVGGSAGNASHAVNDFRKIVGMEAYAPTDNVSELTARINDDGWDSSFANWLKGSRLNNQDAVLVFSVGGRDQVRGQERGRAHRWHCRARRRVYRPGGRCLCHRAGGAS